MKKSGKLAGVVCLLLLMLALAGCGKERNRDTDSSVTPAVSETPTETPVPTATADPGTVTPTGSVEPTGSAEPTGSVEPTGTPEVTPTPVPKNGDIMILFTGDVHCNIDNGFGYAGLKQIRDSLEEQGYTTILVDTGDAIQGGNIGTLTKGEAIIRLMNEVRYDVAIPGNHEFDYGMERFLELVGKADFPYISCNFNKQGELVFAPYVIKEAAGKKIAFVGVTTPKTILDSAPAYFQNDKGEYIYDFMQDETGEAVYAAVQKAVDDARAAGADYVYVMGHLGNEKECEPWAFYDIVEHTSGIDVFLDAHSHDLSQVIMLNKDGEQVVRVASGTGLEGIGYSEISAKEGIRETYVWTWTNEVNVREMFDIRNSVADAVDEVLGEMKEQLNKVIAKAEITLTIYDPTLKDADDKPVRIVRKAETNLGDLCADALRTAAGADIAIMNGGGIKKNIAAGDVTYANIIDVFPYNNQLCVIDVTGQQLLDALEWGAHLLTAENGGFLQVSGIEFQIDVTIPSPCKSDERGMFAGIEGARRVLNVTVGGESIDKNRHYTLAGTQYTLFDQGDGYTVFNGCEVLQDRVKLDNQLLIDYIVETLGGVIGEGYANPYGAGRITMVGRE
jgi:5''-nucleotidase/2'',3''-cyclic phosphodiesterase and related esterases